MNSYIELAFKVATKSTHKHHNMGCVVVKGGSILSVAHNLGTWQKCCERRALRPHVDYRGSTIIVVRSNGRKSKPCQHCQRAIEEAGIKKVVYIDDDGEVVVEKIGGLN